MISGERPTPRSLTTEGRRRALALAYANAGLWAVGNGLASSTLVIYLALGRGSKGLAVSLILAAPHFAGLLRLAVPQLLAWFAHRKAFCIVAYLASAVVLSIVPLAATAGVSLGGAATITLLVAAWCVYHLLEYAGTIVLWSWLGDLAPRRIRGRFCGHRERWLVAGRIAGIGATVVLAWCWQRWWPEAESWQPLALSAALGVVLLAAAVVPLVPMPAVERAPSAQPRDSWRAIWRATFTPPYRQLVLFSCFSSFAHGITAPVHSAYPWQVLNVPYWTMQALRGMMHAGQTALAPTMGRWCDAWGSRPVMIGSLLVVAGGPLFYVAATPERWWWLVGAYVVWMAYAGLNVGLDSVKLKLAPPDNTAPYLAVYYALADLVLAVTMVASGLAVDRFLKAGFDPPAVYASVLFGGFAARLLGVPLLMAITEPGARRLRDILRRQKR